MPKLLSVNVSLPKNVEHKSKIVSTGIFKEPIEGRVKVRTLNIDGDGQADLIGQDILIFAANSKNSNRHMDFQRNKKRA